MRLTVLIIFITLGLSGSAQEHEVVSKELSKEKSSEKNIKGQPFGPKTTAKKKPGSRQLTPLKEKTVIRENGTRETRSYEENK